MTAKTPTHSVTFRIPLHLLNRVNHQQEQTGLSRTAVILLALQHGLEGLAVLNALNTNDDEI